MHFEEILNTSALSARLLRESAWRTCTVVNPAVGPGRGRTRSPRLGAPRARLSDRFKATLRRRQRCRKGCAYHLFSPAAISKSQRWLRTCEWSFSLCCQCGQARPVPDKHMYRALSSEHSCSKSAGRAHHLDAGEGTTGRSSQRPSDRISRRGSSTAPHRFAAHVSACRDAPVVRRLPVVVRNLRRRRMVMRAPDMSRMRCPDRIVCINIAIFHMRASVLAP